MVPIVLLFIVLFASFLVYRGGVAAKIAACILVLLVIGVLASAMMLSSGSATASAERANARSRERAREQIYAPAPLVQDTARYTPYENNPVKQVSRDPVSTFGLDVDTASYANTRRFLNSGRLPVPGAVRVEEMINYFPPLSEERKLEPLGDSPFRVGYEMAPCPWNEENILLWISVNAYGLDYREAPPANLVFLVDVSGSMQPPERLPLAKAALKLLVERLRPEDRVSLVTYAGSTSVVLPPTPGSEKSAILSAIESLGAGGSTAGASGLRLAYEQAEKGFIEGGVNRILLCTDGDFNVGVSSTEELKSMVERQRRKGVTLSVFGFGTDNLNDAMMVQIADVGNGNYSYIDTLLEAQKVLNEEMESTLVTVAKDVKAQIEFNPAAVLEYRQIGYEKRQLRQEDFNNDKIDAGDIGAGKRVTILYELTPVGKRGSVDPLRYKSDDRKESDDKKEGEKTSEPLEKSIKNYDENELAFLKLRWKAPDGDVSSLAETPLLKTALARSFGDAGSALRFSAAVAAFGQKLRGSPEFSSASWKDIAAWAEAAKGSDKGGYRSEFVRLVGLAEGLDSPSMN